MATRLDRASDQTNEMSQPEACPEEIRDILIVPRERPSNLNMAERLFVSLAIVPV